MIDETLIAYGGALKTLDDAGRIGGYLLLWGSDEATDFAGDYFTPETYLGRSVKSDIDLLFYHGLDKIHGLDNPLKDEILGSASVKTDDVGLWMEAVMGMRTDYEAKVFDAVKSGKMGLSSGATNHLVRRERRPNGSNRLVRWPIAEASITPTPAEPRTRAVALKTLLLDSPDAGLPVGQTLEDVSQAALAAVAGLTGRLETHPAMRGGRPLSPARREELKTLHDRIGVCLELSAPRAGAAEWLKEREKSAALGRRLARMGIKV